MSREQDALRRQRQASNALMQLLRRFEVPNLRRIAFELLDPELVYDLPEGAISRNEIIFAILDWRERRRGPSTGDVDALLSKLDDDLVNQRTLLDSVARKWDIELPSWQLAEPSGPPPAEGAPPSTTRSTPSSQPPSDLFLSAPTTASPNSRAKTDTEAVGAFLQAYSRQVFDLETIRRWGRSKNHPQVAALDGGQLKTALDELADLGDAREVERPDGSVRYIWGG